jgi:hypothetical protein
MQSPKKGTVKKTVKPKLKSDEKIISTARQFTKGLTDSFKPIVEGIKTVVPKSKNIRKAIESSPEYKVAKGIKKAAGFKKGGVIRTKKK